MKELVSSIYAGASYGTGRDFLSSHGPKLSKIETLFLRVRVSGLKNHPMADLNQRYDQKSPKMSFACCIRVPSYHCSFIACPDGTEALRP